MVPPTTTPLTHPTHRNPPSGSLTPYPGPTLSPPCSQTHVLRYMPEISKEYMGATMVLGARNVCCQGLGLGLRRGLSTNPNCKRSVLSHSCLVESRWGLGRDFQLGWACLVYLVFCCSHSNLQKAGRPAQHRFVALVWNGVDPCKPPPVLDVQIETIINSIISMRCFNPNRQNT